MPFWNSSAHRFLDIPATIEAYRALAAEAAARDARIRRVVLFGSLATGRATPRSDADLLIVLDEHPAAAMDRIPEYLGYFLKGPMPVDVFPLTEAEINRRKSEGDRFLSRALAEGVEIYRRPE